jgi:PAS domain S-box-containing protein/putative nucleotidyltransferase with HDIG domain
MTMTPPPVDGLDQPVPSDGDVAGNNITPSVAPEPLAPAREAIAAAVRHRTQAIRVAELSRLRPDLGGVITAREIWKHEREQRDLEFKNLLLATQLETSLDGVLVVQDDGRILSANHRFIEMWGIPDDVIRSRSGDLALQFARGLLEAPDAFIQAVNDLRGGKEPVSLGTIHLKDGRAFDSTCAPMTGAAGQSLGRVWYFRDVTERLAAEQALRSSEARYRAMFNQAAVGMTQTTAGGAFAHVNRALCSMLGYSESELTGRSFFDLTHPEDRANSEALRTALLASAGTAGSSIEKRYIRKDGSVLRANVTVTPVPNAQGQVASFVTVVEDITQRKQAQEAERASHALLVSTERLARIGGFQWNVAGETVVWSDEVYRMFGRDPREVSTVTNFMAAVHPADRGRVREAIDAALAGTRRYDVEFRIVRRDASERFIHSEGEVSRDATGNPVCLSGTSHDVTERTVAEQKLRFANALLATQQETSLDGIYVVDDNQKIVSFNRRFAEMWGIPDAVMESGSDELALQTAMDNLESPDEFMHGVRQLYAENARKIHDELRLKDGRTFDRFSSPMLGADGTYYGRAFYFRDITERKRSEQLIRASEARLRAIFEATVDAVAVADPETLKLAAVNTAFCRILGYSPDEASALRVPDLHPPEEVASVLAQFERQARGEIDVAVDIPVRRKDGSVFFADISTATAVIGDKRQTVRVFHDITNRKRSEEELRRLYRSQRLLSEANRALVRAEDESAFFHEMTRLVVEVGGYAMAWVGLAEHDEHKTVRPVAYFTHGAADIDRLQITWGDTDLGKGPTGTAIRTGTIQVNRNTQSNPAMAPWREREARLGHGSSVSLPLRSEPHAAAFGALSIYASTSEAFDAQELQVLEELAGDVAYGVASLRTSIERNAGINRLRLAMESAVETVAATVEARDPYTAGHQRRVAALAEAIGRKLGLDEAVVRGIRFGALIHDVGKIQVPAELLAKPSHLSKIEFELIKTHVQAGHDIVRNIEFPWPVAEMIMQHHERLDGSGYPNGLTGDQMILEARILAVADVVEAMASHRPYRPTIGLSVALADLERGRGSLYDAAVVDACLTLFREERFAFDPVGAPHSTADIRGDLELLPHA